MHEPNSPWMETELPPPRNAIAGLAWNWRRLLWNAWKKAQKGRLREQIRERRRSTVDNRAFVVNLKEIPSKVSWKCEEGKTIPRDTNQQGASGMHWENEEPVQENFKRNGACPEKVTDIDRVVSTFLLKLKKAVQHPLLMPPHHHPTARALTVTHGQGFMSGAPPPSWLSVYRLTAFNFAWTHVKTHGWPRHMWKDRICWKSSTNPIDI